MKKVFNKQPEMTPIDPMKIYYNIGALMDIPTGEYVRGMRGENILNGGMGALTAIAGKPNTFKSTLAHYMTLSAASTIAESGFAPFISTLDTEMNMVPKRLLFFANGFAPFKGVDLISEGIWQVTDQTKHMGDEWFQLTKDYLRDEKIKNVKQYTFATPFVDTKGNQIKTLFPTFGQIDSLSKMISSDVEKMQKDNQISEGQTIYMRQGLAKARMLMELPGICNAAGHYTIVTTHVGKNTNIMQVGGSQIPVKQLQHMKQDEAIKGAPLDFFFLTNNLWQAVTSTAMIHKETKGPEFPRERSDKEENSSDLNRVTLKLLRNKTGPSGHSVDILLSQRDGVQASLTEFYFLKESDGRFGIEGNNTTYNLILYPTVNLQRTTLRETLDNNKDLRRAVKITADLLQIKQLYKNLPFEVPNPADFYKKLDEQYGWDVLLNTRDFWTFNQYEHEVPFLSTMDMLEMYYDKYTPYWWKPSMKKAA